ncbi:hypothetical protein HK097_011151 [Rhizophlyctis rosea]|uniref:SF3 helicase domain-containing protein n=1 Tax=Rhizophlyctis rosea TaxID=64517 RepID=A0AAD5S6R5_9FUNG|nr:hypothetical protein HK097_011151 [Rhizophlyctis rosea]
METFLSQIFPNPDERNYVLEKFAFALNETPATAQFFIFVGNGANGKTTLLKLVSLGFGGYYVEIPVTVFTHQRPAANCPTPEFMAIRGKRVVTCSEANAKDTLNLCTIKCCTGENIMTGRGLFEKRLCTFYPQALFAMSVNQIPTIKSSAEDNGTWRRISHVLFGSTFKENPSDANEF